MPKLQENQNQRTKLIEFSRSIQASVGFSFGLMTCFIMLCPRSEADLQIPFTQETTIKKVDSVVEAYWINAGTRQILNQWSLTEFSHLKKVTTREKDLESGKMTKWDGALLLTLVEKALEKLPVENRAQVDLVILKGKGGHSASIPRALLSKYPLMVAYQADGQNLDAKKGPLYSIVPWTSKPKIKNEELPLESFSIPQMMEIELANYREKYSSLFLKRRTDPSAMRGEKLFVQNCVGCHSMGRGPAMARIVEESFSKKFIIQGHPVLGGASLGQSSGGASAEASEKQSADLRFNERDRKSIIRYLDAHRTENPVSAKSGFPSVQAGRLSPEIAAD